MPVLPKPIVELQKLIAKMPGFSEKGAERFLEWWWQHPNEVNELYKNWSEFVRIKPCKKCFFFSLEGLCDFCKDPTRTVGKICVASSSFTASLIEKGASYRGLYFILDGEVVGSRNYKSIEKVKEKILFLKNRIVGEKIAEIIIATDFTTKGEATALYIEDFLKDTPVEVSRLARGFHPGDTLGYSDPITLRKAFEKRETM